MDDLLTSYISLMLQTLNRQKNAPAGTTKSKGPTKPGPATKPAGTVKPGRVAVSAKFQEKAIPTATVPAKPRSGSAARPKLGAGRMGTSGSFKKK